MRIIPAFLMEGLLFAPVVPVKLENNQRMEVLFL